LWPVNAFTSLKQLYHTSYFYCKNNEQICSPDKYKVNSMSHTDILNTSRHAYETFLRYVLRYVLKPQSHQACHLFTTYIRPILLAIVDKS
jgi:hypothetical protein